MGNKNKKMGCRCYPYGLYYIILWSVTCMTLVKLSIQSTVCKEQVAVGIGSVVLLTKNRQTIDFYHAAAVLHKHKTFCPSSLAVKNLKTSLDGQKQKLLFSWDNLANNRLTRTID